MRRRLITHCWGEGLHNLPDAPCKSREAPGMHAPLKHKDIVQPESEPAGRTQGAKELAFHLASLGQPLSIMHGRQVG